MASALSIIGALTLAAVGAAGMYEYDRHSPIAITVPIPLWRPHVALPDSLLTQRDQAQALAADAASRLDVCHANEGRLQGALDAQDAAVASLQARADAWTAQSGRALAGARAVAESYRQHAAAILETPAPSGDRCAAADALILKEASR